MPKKSSKVARFLKKAAKTKAIKVKAKRSNPDTTAITELGITVGTGAGAYVVNRIASGVVHKALAPRLGRFGSHIGPAASVGFLAMVWYLAEKLAFLRRYQNSVIVGSAIAVFQTILARYLPGVENLLNAANYPVMRVPAVNATGDYVDDEDYSLPGSSIIDMNKTLTAAAPANYDDDDIMSSEGIFGS